MTQQVISPDLISDISRLYTALEYLRHNQADKLTDAGKLAVRQTQATIQRLRLKILDFLKSDSK